MAPNVAFLVLTEWMRFLLAAWKGESHGISTNKRPILPKAVFLLAVTGSLLAQPLPQDFLKSGPQRRLL